MAAATRVCSSSRLENWSNSMRRVGVQPSQDAYSLDSGESLGMAATHARKGTNLLFRRQDE